MYLDEQQLCKTVQKCAKQQCCAQFEWNALQRIEIHSSVVGADALSLAN